ncbi:MAG: hypothetical protein ACREQA_01055, partial [Candidatus Binatia bacterium]
MKPLGWITKVSLLAFSLQLMGTSWATERNVALIKDDVCEQSAETSTAKAKVQAVFGKMPLHFEANQGQADARVKFLSRGHGYTLFLTPNEAVLTLHKSDAKLSPFSSQHATKTEPSNSKLGNQNPQLGSVIRMKPVAANPDPQIVG